jgi:ribonuclease HI
MGIGYVLKHRESSRILARVGAPIGEGTNNEAEYQAFLAGLRHALKLGLWDLTVHSDSLLVVNQTLGVWQVRDRRLVRLWMESQNLLRLFRFFSIEHVRREHNAEADQLSHEIVFEEPDLGPTAFGKRNRTPKALHSWQAAAVRHWWDRFNPGAGTLGRVMGVTPNLIEQIAYGKTYRTAGFEGFTAHLNNLHPALPLPVPS